MGNITRAKDWMKEFRKKRSKAVCATVAENDDMLDAMKYSCHPFSLGAAVDNPLFGKSMFSEIVEAQKLMDEMMNAKIDQQALSNACMNVFLPTPFTFTTWSKTALHNLLRGIW